MSCGPTSRRWGTRRWRRSLRQRSGTWRSEKSKSWSGKGCNGVLSPKQSFSDIDAVDSRSTGCNASVSTTSSTASNRAGSVFFLPTPSQPKIQKIQKEKGQKKQRRRRSRRVSQRKTVHWIKKLTVPVGKLFKTNEQLSYYLRRRTKRRAYSVFCFVSDPNLPPWLNTFYN